MDTKKERMMILDMIAEGKITAADGEQLFKALQQSSDDDESAAPEVGGKDKAMPGFPAPFSGRTGQKGAVSFGESWPLPCARQA